MNELLFNALCARLGAEIYAELNYLSMSAAMRCDGYAMMARHFAEMAQRHHRRAMSILIYIENRGCMPIIPAVFAPEHQWDSIEILFGAAQKVEEQILQAANELMGMALQYEDFALIAFLNLFLNEQVVHQRQALENTQRVGQLSGNLSILDIHFASYQETYHAD